MALSRECPSEKQSGCVHVHFDLDDDLAPDALTGVDALVHAAYDFNAVRWGDIKRVNIEGSRRLFAAAREAGVRRIVLVSTMAAFPEARSRYGRAKLEIERAALEVGAAIIRPGLVWGPRGAAMFGALRRTIGRLQIVPVLVPGELELRLVHEDDLAALVAGVLNRWPAGSGELVVAAPERSTTFMELLRSLAPRTGRQPLFVRMPWRTAWLALRMLETLGAKPPFRSDSLVSLVETDADPLSRATDRAERYGVRFRPYTFV
jgi:nucleoside-diphosphate-sugar epimerase